MNHTKEPWNTGEPLYPRVIISEYEREDIARVTYIEDAQRIVACVNACADVDDKLLATGRVKDQLEELVRVLNAVCLLFDNGIRKITVGERASLMIAQALIKKYPKEWTD